MKMLRNVFFAFMITACFMIMAMPVHAQAGAAVALPENIQKILDQGAVWVGLVVLVWEYMLSKTSIVKSNSTIDLVVAGVKKLFGIK